MITAGPSFATWALSESASSGIDVFFRRYAERYWLYGSGKVALRDGLSVLANAGETVLVPSYLPDAVVEPISELGLEPRYYSIESDLSPDVADLESRLDDRTAAIVSVNYFGFPQPGLADLTALADEYECYHVDDNAHAPLSVDEGTLLGTRGHIGTTSLWKLLPIPNGAVLYVTDEAIADRFEPSRFGVPSDHFDGGDARFVLTSLATDVLDGHRAVRGSVDALVDRVGEGGAADPKRRYTASKTRLSPLSAHVVENTDPERIRSARRANYRAWVRVLEDRAGIELLFPSLPEGICPQVCPVRVDAPERLRRSLERCGVDAHTWPRLSTDVVDDPAYETATRLSREVLTLPVHQHVDPESIDSVGRRLGRR